MAKNSSRFRKWLLGSAYEEHPVKADVVVLSGTNHYEERNKQVIEEYRKQNKQVLYLTSDFHHINKQQYVFEVEGCKQVHVRPYYKNISISRLLSHGEFSFKAYFYLKQHKPDIVYTEIPNNSLALSTALYKKKHGCHLIFDIFDMWPEALPVKTGNPIVNFALSIWGAFRNLNLNHADKIFTECEYYQEILQKEGYTMPMETKYLCQEDEDLEIKTVWKKDQIHICYVGSINNIINAPLMVSFLDQLNQKRKVYFHMIGQGESKERIKQELEKKQVKVIDYGSIYDKHELQEIFNQCSFAINFLVPDVAIGITMKSVTYFRGGMPILNTVDGDTRKMVATRNVGINVAADKIEETIDVILQMEEIQICEMKQNARAVFEEFFKKSES
ncbi:MAG: glycosyltransferase [Agathobacter sp.]|nr:glycosyltransferase [Agathobacter sp.]